MITPGIKHGATKLGIAPEEYEAHVEAGESWCSAARHWVPLAGYSGEASRRSACRACKRILRNQDYHRRHPQALRRHCAGCRCGEEATP